MYAAVQQYIEAVEAAQDQYRRVTDDKYRATEEEANREGADGKAVWDRYYEAVDAAAAERATARDTARAALREALDREGDKLGVFIVDNALGGDYRDEALTALKALPATAEELTALARSRSWCNVFDRFLRQARAAGVFGPVTARETLEEWFSSEIYSKGSSYFRTLGEHLDAVVAEARGADTVTTDVLADEHRVQLDRVDAVWNRLAEQLTSGRVASVDGAEALFREAVRAVVEGGDVIPVQPVAEPEPVRRGC